MTKSSEAYNQLEQATLDAIALTDHLIERIAEQTGKPPELIRRAIFTTSVSTGRGVADLAYAISEFNVLLKGAEKEQES